ncbi:transcriptional regulator domain-containing protein [Sphingomonas sp. OTU376]|uniref:transcriptional regulator domain-containing protein n=1 Tax=Sphingomonas sp. OTU376 TaxID=3043863 RepID=UPI00313C7C1B
MAGRQSTFEDPRGGLDIAGFAQEFLRRNPDYRREYAELHLDRVDPNGPDPEVMARRWGLIFPGLA